MLCSQQILALEEINLFLKNILKNSVHSIDESYHLTRLTMNYFGKNSVCITNSKNNNSKRKKIQSSAVRLLDFCIMNKIK